MGSTKQSYRSSNTASVWNPGMAAQGGDTGKELKDLNDRDREFIRSVYTAAHLDPEEYFEEESGKTAMEFSDKTVRRGFIRKVYSIISLQLLLTVGTMGLFKKSYSIRYVIGQRGLVFWVIFAVCAGMIVVPYDDQVVMIAGGVTAGIVIGLTIFAFQTKIDFTMMGGALFCVLLVFIIIGFLMAFLPRVEKLHLLYAGIGVLIFSLYLVYDTQMMMGGEHKYSVSPEEYIFAAIAIYLDIINLFLYILKIVNAAKK